MPTHESNNDDFWASLNDSTNLMVPPPPRPYHYLTRSQSVGSYQPKYQQQNQQHISATQQQHASASMGYGNVFGVGQQEQQHAYQAHPQSHVPFHQRQLQQQRQEQDQRIHHYEYPYNHEVDNEHGDVHEHEDEHEDDEREDGMMGTMGFADPNMRGTHGFGMWEAAPPNRPLSPIDEGALSYSDADSPTGVAGGPGGVAGGLGGLGMSGNGGTGGASGLVNNDDAASVHSTHSSLFLRRPVRRTTSSNTITSVTSAPARFSPTDTPHSGPPRTFKRSPVTLSIIPQSPRASQMSHDTGGQVTGMPQPPPPAVVYPQHLSRHPSFHQSLEEALARHGQMVKGYGEYDSDNPPNNMSTPSLVSRSESQHTQITYATESALPSRRQSTVPMEGTNGSSESKVGMAAKLKGSLNTFMTKSHKLASATKSSLHLRTPLSAKAQEQQLEEGRGEHHARFDSGNDDDVQRDSRRFSIASWRKALRDTSSRSKPAEFLFWTGFIAPWCWLIGGWMLANNGEPIVEGFPRDSKNRNLKAENMNRHPSTMSILPMYNDANYTSRAPLPYEQGEKTELNEDGHYDSTKKGMPGPSSTSSHQRYTFPEPETFPPPSFRAITVSDSKLEPISSTPMPMPNSASDPTDFYMHKALQASVSRFPVPGRPVFMMRKPKVKLSCVKAVQVRMKHDPWVVRCRVMAIISGMVILALVIIAFIVLIRAL